MNGLAFSILIYEFGFSSSDLEPLLYLVLNVHDHFNEWHQTGFKICRLLTLQDAVDCATQALEKYNIEKDIAAYIKKEFDKKYNPHLALHRRKELRLLRDARNATLYLLLPWTSRHSPVQEWINYKQSELRFNKPSQFSLVAVLYWKSANPLDHATGTSA